MTAMLSFRDVGKSFVLHQQGGTVIPVLSGVTFDLMRGQCMALTGPSGTGKSTVLRLAYGNYRCQHGSILVCHDGAMVDIAGAEPRVVLEIRRRTLGYVSQFLRVIPRVPTLDVVAEPLQAIGTPQDEARERAGMLLRRLNIPERLWSLSPLTFSGGEQQRVNIARGFVAGHPVLLLDEPTASLDAANREVVLDLIREAAARGTSILGIFHDAAAREAVCTATFDVSAVRAAA
ncbi:MAG: phosphonate C-P lyase system protein PhnL [Pseudomonadota bacterium]|nr:phosphonate C-P lyase system protein PhnL [Pseudomonadota bacterium]